LKIIGCQISEDKRQMTRANESLSAGCASKLDGDAGADTGSPACRALDPERPAQAQRPLAHRAQPKVPGELATRVEANAVVCDLKAK
jgi:hypothetical protein